MTDQVERQPGVFKDVALKLRTMPAPGSRANYLSVQFHWSNTLQLSSRIGDQYINATFNKKAWRELLGAVKLACNFKEVDSITIQASVKKQGQMQKEADVIVGRDADGRIYLTLSSPAKGRECTFPFAIDDTLIMLDKTRQPLSPFVTSTVAAREWVEDITSFVNKTWEQMYKEQVYNPQGGGQGGGQRNNYNQGGGQQSHSNKPMQVDGSFDDDIIM